MADAREHGLDLSNPLIVEELERLQHKEVRKQAREEEKRRRRAQTCSDSRSDSEASDGDANGTVSSDDEETEQRGGSLRSYCIIL